MCNCFIWFSAGVLMRPIQCQWLVPGRLKQTWLRFGWRWRGPDYKSLFEDVDTRILKLQLQKNQTVAFWDCSMLNKFIFKNIEINKVKCKNETPVCKWIHCNFILNLYFFNAYVSKSGSFQPNSVLESAYCPAPISLNGGTHLPPGEEAKAVNWWQYGKREAAPLRQETRRLTVKVKDNFVWGPKRKLEDLKLFKVFTWE